MDEEDEAQHDNAEEEYDYEEEEEQDDENNLYDEDNNLIYPSDYELHESTSGEKAAAADSKELSSAAASKKFATFFFPVKSRFEKKKPCKSRSLEGKATRFSNEPSSTKTPKLVRRVNFADECN